MRDEKPSYDEKLALILRSTAAVFAAKGYHRASIRDISRATGVSLSGLYYYVKSKEELLFLIQDHCFGTVLANVERLLHGVEEPRRRLRLFIENHLRFFVANMEEMKVLSHEAESLTGEYRRRVDGVKRQYAELCTGILEDLRPAGSPLDLRVATFSLFGMLNWVYNWYHPDGDVPVSELAEDMDHLFMHGFLAGTADVAAPSGPEGTPGEASPSIWRQ